MTQPLPSWLKLVTLRYQDSDQFTIGLVELPLTYRGPSIPLTWPFTSISSDSLTASPPLSTSVSSSPQVIQFIDGGGPFSVIGDVILTPTPTTRASPATSTTAMISATSTQSEIHVTTIVVAQPTPNSSSLASNPGNLPSTSLALGFIIVLIILIVMLFSASIILIKRHKRRRNDVGGIDKNDDCFSQDNNDDFDADSYSQDLEHSRAPRHPSRNVIPTLLHPSLNAQIQEKKVIHPETQFLITRQRSPTNRAFGWMPLKKLIAKLQGFRQTDKHRAVIVCDQLQPQFIPHHSNPYHDPSVRTDTGERVSRWRMKCDSPSPSALRLPPSISSNKHDPITDDSTSRDSLSEKIQSLDVNYMESAYRGQYAPEDKAFGSTPTSSDRKPAKEMHNGDHQSLQDLPLNPSERRRTDLEHRLPQCASSKVVVSKSQSDCSRKSMIRTALLNASAHVSSSLGFTTKEKNDSKTYSDDSPPLLIVELEGDAFESDGPGAGNSSPELDDIAQPSPSGSRKGTPSSAASPGLENSIVPICSPRSTSPSVSSLPLVLTAKKVRRKKSSLTSSPSPSLSRPPPPGQLRKVHVSASKLTSSLNSSILPSLHGTPTVLPKKRRELSACKRSDCAFGPPQSHVTFAEPTGDLNRGESSLDGVSDYEGLRAKQAENSGDGGDFPVEVVPTGAKFPMKHRTSTFQGLIIGSSINVENTADEITQMSSNGDDFDPNEYTGSKPIGNTGGVSELGSLESHASDPDRFLTREIEIQSGMDFPVSINQCPTPTSPPASSGNFDGDEYSCKSEELFYVKPQVGNVLGRKKTTETSIGARSDWEFTSQSWERKERTGDENEDGLQRHSSTDGTPEAEMKMRQLRAQ